VDAAPASRLQNLRGAEVSIDPIDILGGESVYCINQSQLGDAKHLATEDVESAPRIQEAIKAVEAALSRNEQAALAFMLIERLRA
jgi:hypothetical protein